MSNPVEEKPNEEEEEEADSLGRGSREGESADPSDNSQDSNIPMTNEELN